MAPSGGTPPELDPAGGWFIQPRAWRASELYRALRTAEARHVAELVLFDRPRYRDEEYMFGSDRFTVRRGELFDSEESLAARAGTSRKVLRTVLRKLERAGLIARRKVHPAGQCPTVITVLHYEASQRLPGHNGPANGPENGTADGPTDGPAKGPQGNEVNPKGTATEPTNQRAGGLESFREKLGSRLGVRVGIGRHPETKRPEDVVAFFEKQIAAVGEESLLIECCDLAAKSTNGVPTTLGFLVNWVANLPDPQRPRPADAADRNRHRMGVVGTNFDGPAPWDLPDLTTTTPVPRTEKENA